MQYTEYEFIAEMRTGDYVDDAFKITGTAISRRDAIIELVVERVEEFAREEDYQVAKAKAEQYIARKLGSFDWTPEQFCDGWINLWASEYQLIRVYSMESVRTFPLPDEPGTPENLLRSK
ncbi:MAG TPA: hypothetical protein VGB73_00960 [Pyrinomonadaceae bacterium]|jgi:hypothetical protein